MATQSNSLSAKAYRGNDRVLFGFILGLLSFWLFGMTILNVNVVMNQDLGLPNSSLNLAVSITALFSGMTVVVFGGLADKIGRVKITRLGFLLAIAGAALIAFVVRYLHFRFCLRSYSSKTLSGMYRLLPFLYSENTGMRREGRGQSVSGVWERRWYDFCSSCRWSNG